MPVAAWIALVAVSITVLVQFAGVIWFAATQRSLLSSQIQIVQSLQKAVASLELIANTLDKRVTILEDRAARIG